MKTKLIHAAILSGSLLLVACGKAPTYQPSAPATGATAPAKQASADGQNKVSQTPANSSTNPDTKKADDTKPATPPAAPPPAPAAPAANLATGRSFIMTNCTAGCHVMNAIDAKTEAALTGAINIQPHGNIPAAVKQDVFVKPATGLTNFSHVLAYLTAKAPVTQANLPAP